MVDREARNRTALALRRFASGRLSFDEMEKVLAPLTRDPDFRLRRKSYTNDAAIHEIVSSVRGHCWDWEEEMDCDESALQGPEVFGGENRERLSRSVLFLQSNIEYEWPETGCLSLLLGVLSFGLLAHDTLLPETDRSIWPFLRRCDYENALLHPRFLCGRP